MSDAQRVDRLELEIGELLAVHAARGEAADLSRYRDDPVGFIRDELHEPILWERQEDIAVLVRDNPQVAVAACNSAGKDWIAARLALWWVYARRGFVLISGPGERQVKEVVMREVARAFAKATDLPGQLFDLSLRIGGSESQGILAFTSRDASRVTGFHAPALLVILTEAQAFEGFGWEGMFANMTGDDSRMLVVGNPLFASGKFRDCFRSPSWKTVTLSAEEHPNVVSGENRIPGAITRAGVELIAREYGRDSNIYRSRVLGQFPEDASESLVRRGWVEAAQHRWRGPVLEFTRQSVPVIGVDVARLGGDQSIMAIWSGGAITHLIPLKASDTMETVEEILRQVALLGIKVRQDRTPALSWPDGRHLPLSLIRVDAAGLGYGVFDRLRELQVNVEGFIGAGAPRVGQGVVHNARAEALFGLRHLLEEGQLSLPPDDMLLEELVGMQWAVNTAGRIQIESKDEIRKRLGRSPDFSDAVALACYGLWRPAGSAWTTFDMGEVLGI